MFRKEYLNAFHDKEMVYAVTYSCAGCHPGCNLYRHRQCSLHEECYFLSKNRPSGNTGHSQELPPVLSQSPYYSHQNWSQFRYLFFRLFSVVPKLEICFHGVELFRWQLRDVASASFSAWPLGAVYCLC